MSFNRNPDWSDERKEVLKQYWRSHSAARIAEILNKLEGPLITRNAVIAKGYRMKLPPKVGVKTENVARAAKPAAPARPSRVPAPRKAAPKPTKVLSGAAAAAPAEPKPKTGFNFAVSTVEQKKTWQQIGQSAIAALETETKAETAVGVVMAKMEDGMCWRILGRSAGADLYCGSGTEIKRGRRAMFCPGCSPAMYIQGKSFNPKGLRRHVEVGYAR